MAVVVKVILHLQSFFLQNFANILPTKDQKQKDKGKYHILSLYFATGWVNFG
jgi:hypothetical protein